MFRALRADASVRFCGSRVVSSEVPSLPTVAATVSSLLVFRRPVGVLEYPALPVPACRLGELDVALL